MVDSDTRLNDKAVARTTETKIAEVRSWPVSFAGGNSLKEMRTKRAAEVMAAFQRAEKSERVTG